MAAGNRGNLTLPSTRPACGGPLNLGVRACPAMSFDDLSLSLIVAAFIFGPLTIIMVGSQTPEDARSVATWTLIVLVPMLLASCASFALPGRSDGSNGGSGMVVLCSALIAAVDLGYRIAASRDKRPRGTSKDKKSESLSCDDELA
jgi:hypothetical protein